MLLIDVALGIFTACCYKCTVASAIIALTLLVTVATFVRAIFAVNTYL